MKTREEAARYIETQFSVGPISREKNGAVHYGYQEVRELMDFIYGGEPCGSEEIKRNTDYAIGGKI